MAKRESIHVRSQRTENRMARYLFGPEAIREWKEEHDIRGDDAFGEVWIGEVKSTAWPSAPGAMWTHLHKAFAQACRYGSERVFAAWLPKGCEVRNAAVMYRERGLAVAVSAQAFRADVLGWWDDDEEDDED